MRRCLISELGVILPLFPIQMEVTAAMPVSYFNTVCVGSGETEPSQNKGIP